MFRALIAMLMLAFLGGAAVAGSRDLDDPSVGVGSWSRGTVPTCEQSSVLNDISKRYRSVQADLWQTGLSIAAVHRIDETEYKPGDPGLIDRRFCRARIELSNGHPAELFYLIEERQGFASIGWGVEFCVPGQDPWRVYDGHCRAIRR